MLINTACSLSQSPIPIKDVNTLTFDYVLLEHIPFIYYPRTERVIPFRGPVSRFIQFQTESSGVGVGMTSQLENVTLSHYIYPVEYFICMCSGRCRFSLAF